MAEIIDDNGYTPIPKLEIKAVANNPDATQILVRDDATGKVYYIDKNELGGGVQKTTYANLKTLLNNSQLKAGQQYRITDFVTKVSTSITNAISAENAFDIIVTADSENVLNESARAIRHDGDTYFPIYTKFESWELKYSIFNDRLRYDWADDVDGKGVIYFIKDDFGNEFPYDFKSVKFKRFKVSAVSNPDLEAQFLGRYYGTEDNSLLTLSMSDSAYLYTFHKENFNTDFSISYDLEYGKSFGFNIMKPNLYATIVDDVKFTTYVLNNNVFLVNENANVKANIFGMDCQNNTFGNGIYYNTFGNDMYYNTFGNEILSNTFGNDIFSNTFGNDMRSNTFGNDMRSNTFGNSVYSNTFGNGLVENTFGNFVSSNTFGNDMRSNTFGGIGITIKIQDGVKGGFFEGVNHEVFDIGAQLATFATTPRYVEVMQSATSGTYIFTSRVSAGVTESFDYVLPII